MNNKFENRDIKNIRLSLFIFNIQILFFISIFFNIYIFRQILGFIYLSFISGYLILSILKISDLSISKIILYSIGISLLFLMTIGFLINEFFNLFGYNKPLSTYNLLTILMIMNVILTFINYFINNKNIKVSKNNKINYDYKSEFTLKINYIFIFFIFIFPLLSIIGIEQLLINGDNIILLVLFSIIPIVITLCMYLKQTKYQKYYKPLLISISLSLLYHESLATLYLYGYDIHLEYYVFKLTKTLSLWSNIIIGTSLRTFNYNNMLSITILPTIYSNLLNLSEIYIFKILYPIIYLAVPIGLYEIYSTFLENKKAFLATFFFMSFYVFYRSLLSTARQMIGELFLVLILNIIMENKINNFKKQILIIIFMIGITISHYACSYLLLYIFLIALLISYILKEKIIINKNIILLYTIIIFITYISFYRSSPFITIIASFNNIIRNFISGFFNPETKSELLLTTMGFQESISYISLFRRIVHYVSQFFICIGLFIVFLKRKNNLFNKTYIFISIPTIFLWIMVIGIPYFAEMLKEARIYHLSLIILAPFYVLGGEEVFNIINNRHNQFHVLVRARDILLVIIVILIFFTDTGYLAEITGDIPVSNSLSMYRQNPVILYEIYTSGYDVASAEWLKIKCDPSLTIYGDLISRVHVLTSSGMMLPEQIKELSNNTRIVDYGAYIYLRSVNTLYGKLVYARAQQYLNTSDINLLLIKLNKIYSNGGSEIFKAQ